MSSSKLIELTYFDPKSEVRRGHSDTKVQAEEL